VSDVWTLGVLLILAFVAGAVTAVACLVWAAVAIAKYQARQKVGG